MKYMTIDQSTIEAVSAAVDYWAPNMTNVTAEKTEERVHLTLNPVLHAPFYFTVLTGNSYLDLQKTRIESIWQLMKQDSGTSEWKPTESKDNISVINGLGEYFIRNLDVTLMGQTAYDSNNLYPYVAYIDNELHHTEEAKKSSLNAIGYYYDSHGKSKQVWKESRKKTVQGTTQGTTTETTEEVIMTTEAWAERRDLFVGGKYVNFVSPLHGEIYQQRLFLLPNMEMKIEIYPMHTEFLVHAPYYTGKVKLELKELKLYTTYVDLHPNVTLEIEKRLKVTPARYPMRRLGVKTNYYDPGRMEAYTTVFTDQVPRTLYVFFVAKDAYNGTTATDPFNFIYANLENIQIRAGNTVTPSVLWDMDPENGRYMRPFAHLHNTMGPSGRKLDCGINLKMFYDGYAIYPFNLSTTQDDEEAFDFIRDAPTIAYLKWRKPLPEGGVMGGFIAKYDSMMFIDETRTVRTDMSV